MARSPLKANDLQDRVAFDQRGTTADDYGNTEDVFAEQFTVAARIMYLRGTEPVIAERLQGVQPIVVTVRDSSETRPVDTSWRLRDVRDGTVMNIRAVTPSDDRKWIDYLCDTGRG